MIKARQSAVNTFIVLMTISFPSIAHRTGPRYMAIAEAIQEAIKSGELAEGAQLPPQRDLADHLGLTVSTVTRGYALAKQHGYLTGEVGRGSFARDPRKSAFAFKFEGAGAAPAAADADMDLTCYRPAPSEQLAAIARACSELPQRLTPRMASLRYPPPAGLTSHRTMGKDWLARGGLETQAQQVLVCSGAQQGIATLLMALAAPGDTVLTESLTYSGLRELSGLLRLKLEGVAIDEAGAVPESLDELAGGGARLLFVQPNLHNPTTTVMPLERRLQIVEIARRRDLTIIEDDVCGALMTDRPPSLAMLAPERTCYVTSLSKCLSPPLRVAFVATPPEFTERVVAAHRTLTLSAPPIMAEIARALIDSGEADQLIEAQRRETARRHAIAAEILAAHSFSANPCGFHIWLTLPAPWRAIDFASAARVLGVKVVSSDNFVVGRGHAPHAVRVALTSTASEDSLRRGLQILDKLLSSGNPSFGTEI
jgi:DNA-binding transcriptional MocR family regulator